MLDEKCVPTDMTPFLGAIEKERIAGLSLWIYAVMKPTMLQTHLGMDSDLARAIFTQVRVGLGSGFRV